ncbi:MFS transporter [Rhodococcus pyridinivorans]|uniref:MFS transporter n=3 Tax=Rhodococcus TaxID=1827 RepID=H0JL97_9NOCA|nr:MFS transporter [Rhodococcus pyridinivorans]EHK86432.1 MFS transporter [Rhodococcus pyridinivorans AK37]MXQ78728.1 MFS transporter [Rhodococcus rhodochrous]BDB61471.1 MFS transporter [Rhodococcus sp. RDE2]SEC64834.1 Predicted arabinose efflux permease, MFS family [Rhodococcus pyridinivorans]
MRLANIVGIMRTRDAALPREIWVLVVASFVIALGFGLVAPALPQFARSFDVGVTAATVVVSSFAAMRLLFAPASGSLVQKLGERPVYITGLLIVALSTGACAFAASYWQLLVFRALGGIGSTMFTVSALGLLVRIAPPDARGRVSGLYATSFLMGNILGPLFGGALIGLGLRAPFLIYAVALLVAASVVGISLRSSELARPDSGDGVPVMRLRDALRSPVYRAALGSNFANGWVVFGVRVAMVPLFVVEALDEGEAFAGVALTAFAVGNALVLIKSGKLSDRFGRRPFVLAGLVVCGVSTIAMGFTESVVWFLITSFVAGMGSGLSNPSQQAAVADVVGSKARGGPVLATFQMVADVGAVIGPVAAGFLADRLSYSTAFAVTGVIMLAATLPWFVVGRPRVVEQATQVTDDTAR